MEPWKWQQLLWTAGFLGITYIPLQCVAIWKCRGVARVAAGLPLLVMIPMLYGAIQPSNYHSGSLLGMYFVFVYFPAMIYLFSVSLIGSHVPKVCPHCGHQRRVKSFQITGGSTLCDSCGKDLLKPATPPSGG